MSGTAPPRGDTGPQGKQPGVSYHLLPKMELQIPPLETIIGKLQVVPSFPCCFCCEHNSNRNKERLNVYFPQLQFILGASLQFVCPLDGAPGLARENRKRETTETGRLRSPSSGHSGVPGGVCLIKGLPAPADRGQAERPGFLLHPHSAPGPSAVLR